MIAHPPASHPPGPGPMVFALSALLLLGAPALLCRAQDADIRFRAIWSDGTDLATAEDVQQWAATDERPTLAGRALLSPDNPVRWLANESLPVAPPPDAFLEFVGGDRLPGQIVRIEPSASTPPGATEFIVEPARAVTNPAIPTQRLVRIDSRSVQRIVLAGSARRELAPGTVFLRDGRQLQFTSARFSSEQLRLLTQTGIETLSLADIREMHLPESSGWDTYYRLLATWNPGLDERMVQLETRGGLQVTSCLAAFRAAHYGDRSRSESWYQIVQPVWSRQPLWVPFPSIREWRFFEPHHVPLTLLDPVAVHRAPIFGSGWTWSVNRNVTGARALGPSGPACWGFGVHGDTRLDFVLPEAARAFRCRLFLDRSAGTGGCVQGRVLLQPGSAESPAERLLFESDILVGSRSIAGTGALPLPRPDSDANSDANSDADSDADSAATTPTAGTGMPTEPSGQRQLSLELDAVRPEHKDFPAGADPYDIRDLAVWAEPELELDPSALREAVTPYVASQTRALDGWQLTAGRLVAEVVWDEANWMLRGFRRLTAPRQQFVAVSRSLRLGADANWLYVHVFRESEASVPSRLQVRANGRVLGEQRIPHRSGAFLPDPLLFAVTALQGQTVAIDLILISDSSEPSVTWQASGLSAERPTLQPLVDEGGPRELPLAADLQHRYWRESPFLGRAALLCTPPGVRLEAAGARVFPIREFPAVGEFRFLRFAWKKRGGAGIGLGLGNAGFFGNDVARATLGNSGAPGSLVLERRGMQNAYRYFAGRWTDPEFSGLRIADRIPEQWQVVTRDLFSDFGAVNLSGLELLCPDGQDAQFDAVYLARSQQALEQISDPSSRADATADVAADSAAPASGGRHARLPERFGPLLDEVAPGFGLTQTEGDLALLPEYAGRGPALRLHPVAQDVPARLTRLVQVASPPGQLGLKIAAAHHDGGGWELRVLANGEPVLSKPVNGQTASDGWLDASVDLSATSGRHVLIEIECHSPGGSHESCYLGAITIENSDAEKP